LIHVPKKGIDSRSRSAIKEQQDWQVVSNVNIRRAVENIRANTTAYTPVVEATVNAIQAIASTDRKDGKVTIRALRSGQLELDDTVPAIVGFEVEDNGVGFNDEHRDSFDTLYSDLKVNEGGKGFGRFTCLKHFEDLHVVSVFNGADGYRQRRFSMGKEHDIIVNEVVSGSDSTECGTVIHLDRLKRGSYEKKLPTIARTLVEKLLPYFITKDYTPPEIILCERDGSGAIRLNDFASELGGFIHEIPAPNNVFTLPATKGEQAFSVRVFKFRSPKNHKSRISLVAHKREVSGTAIHNYIPEFLDEFYEKDAAGNSDSARNYIIKAYVFGPYLDDNVSLERGEFEFKQENDLLLGISQREIESRAAEIAKNAIGEEISTRQDKKKERVQVYVDEEAPWHRAILEKIDLSTLPYDASHDDIESKLQRAKFSHEMQIKREVKTLLATSDAADLKTNVAEVVNKISVTSKNDLIHYIALRRNILELLERGLELGADGKYSAEGVVHDIIFPRKEGTDTIPFEKHNLWLVDERLNFTKFISSDIPLTQGKDDRPDLLVYNNRIGFRGDNETSNPITIFELKKPHRDDFANPKSKDDPVEQIVRYVNKIRAGKFKAPKGRVIDVAANTPFYGFVVCTLTPKVKKWLDEEKDFTPMPDGLGWFHWRGNIRLYIEVLSWDKVLKDARMRNAIFFHKLGI
jgi:hypothetical protein